MSAPTVTTVVVGGYTPEQGHAEGLSTLRLEASDDGAVEVRRVDVLALDSPSFVVADPARDRLYAVSETSPSQVHAVALAPDGALRLLASTTTEGAFACHLALSPAGDRLAVAEYGSGSVALLEVGDDGALTVLDRLVLVGDGPDPERQEAAHAHQAVWVDDELLVPDLGSDRVHRLRVSEDRLVPAGPPVVLPPGTGPRHLAVAGVHLVVVGELAGTVWLGRRAGDGSWTEAGVVPSSWVERSGRLHPSGVAARPSGDGFRIWVANRGPDTVAELRLDPLTDRLEPVAEASCGGANPRDLAWAAGRLWVPNQDGHTLSLLDPERLEAGAVLVLDAPSPACVAVLGSDERG